MMKPLFTAVCAMMFIGSYEAAIPYFGRVRMVTVIAPEKQNYLVVDGDVWQHARPDLSDLRIYDGQTKVPYVLVKQSGGSKTQETPAKLLNLGTIGGRTEFDLDTSGFEDYDRVRMQMDAKNFINVAQVEGRHALNDRSGTKLGSTTLYDFSKEGLGSNFVLKFPPASFAFLHVRLAPGIRPDQVKGAYLSSFLETKAAWTNAGDCNPATGQAKQTVYQCSVAGGMPVERITFSIPANRVNFNRAVVLSDELGNEFQRGSISRVRMNRDGQQVTSEELSLDLYPDTRKQIRVVVENGDDPPLPIERVQPFAVERRLYFDSKGSVALQLYYGDAKLEAPTYDYAKFFQQSADAGIAQLGPPQANPQFSGRPDERPWSERHSIVLWVAMLVAVAVLGGLALKGLKGSSATAR